MTRPNPFPRARRAAALLGAGALAGLLLAGCGGDDDTPAPTTPASTGQVPASAAVSDASFEAFAIGLPQTDTAEPLALDDITTLPSSEDTEPIAIAAD